MAERCYWYPRPDVAEFFHLAGRPRNELRFGWVVYIELPGCSQANEGWTMVAEDSAGARVESSMPAMLDDEELVRGRIVSDIALEQLHDDELRRKHLMPALDRMQKCLMDDVAIESIDQFGEPPAEPIVSIVIPLYRRVEFLEHQLAQFVLDPELAEADIIYVLDSPEDANYLRRFAQHLYQLYGVPFRLVVLGRNGGFSIANNLGHPSPEAASSSC